MNKLIKILPFIAIFLIAMSIGDKLWSLSYCIKVIPALLMLVITSINIIIYLKNKFKTP